MRAGISFLILIVVSTGAFAEDKNNQANVYDEFRQWMKPLPDATVDEEVTARIKRHMANLLYPVDMASFVRPEQDVKFREQIIALQKQMGAPPTGTLTSDQFDRLAEAARDIDDRPIGTYPGKLVERFKNGELVWAVGTGTTDDQANPLAHPINISRIWCLRSSGTCELSTAEFSPEDSHLYFSTPFAYGNRRADLCELCGSETIRAVGPASTPPRPRKEMADGAGNGCGPGARAAVGPHGRCPPHPLPCLILSEGRRHEEALQSSQQTSESAPR